MMQSLLQAEAQARDSLYSSLEVIAAALDRYKKLSDDDQENDTKLISRIGNTPIHRENELHIKQTDEMNNMIRSVCVAEYAARQFADPVILTNALQETGLDYSAVFLPLKMALDDLKNENRIGKLQFLAKQILSHDDYKLFDLMAKKDQKFEDYDEIAAIEFVQQSTTDPAEIQKRLNMMHEQSGPKVLTPLERLSNFMTEKYLTKFYISPYFPERLLAHGYEVFQTQLCNHTESTFCNFDGFYTACPGCFKPEGLKFAQSRDLLTSIRCFKTKKLINTEQDYYFFPEKGFLSVEGKNALSKEEASKAIKVNLIW